MLTTEYYQVAWRIMTNYDELWRIMTNYNETRQIVGKNEKKKSFHNLYFMEEVSPKAYRLEIGREKKRVIF